MTNSLDFLVIQKYYCYYCLERQQILLKADSIHSSEVTPCLYRSVTIITAILEGFD